MRSLYLSQKGNWIRALKHNEKDKVNVSSFAFIWLCFEKYKRKPQITNLCVYSYNSNSQLPILRKKKCEKENNKKSSEKENEKEMIIIFYRNNFIHLSLIYNHLLFWVFREKWWWIRKQNQIIFRAYFQSTSIIAFERKTKRKKKNKANKEKKKRTPERKDCLACISLSKLIYTSLLPAIITWHLCLQKRKRKKKDI